MGLVSGGISMAEEGAVRARLLASQGSKRFWIENALPCLALYTGALCIFFLLGAGQTAFGRVKVL